MEVVCNFNIEDQELPGGSFTSAEDQNKTLNEKNSG